MRAPSGPSSVISIGRAPTIRSDEKNTRSPLLVIAIPSVFLPRRSIFPSPSLIDNRVTLNGSRSPNGLYTGISRIHGGGGSSLCAAQADISSTSTIPLMEKHCVDDVLKTRSIFCRFRGSVRSGPKSPLCSDRLPSMHRRSHRDQILHLPSPCAGFHVTACPVRTGSRFHRNRMH